MLRPKKQYQPSCALRLMKIAEYSRSTSSSLSLTSIPKGLATGVRSDPVATLSGSGSTYFQRNHLNSE